MVGRVDIVAVVGEIAGHHAYLLPRFCGPQVLQVLLARLAADLYQEFVEGAVFPLPVRPAHVADLDALDSVCRKIGEVDVVVASEHPGALQQLVQDSGEQRRHCREVGVMVEGVETHADGRYSVHGSLHSGSEGPGIKRGGGGVAAVVDAADHEVGALGPEYVVDSVFDAAGRSAVEIPPAFARLLAQFPDGDRPEPHAHRHGHSALRFLGGDHGQITVGTEYFNQLGDAFRLESVVVRHKNFHLYFFYKYN